MKMKTTSESGTTVELWLDESNKEIKGSLGDYVEGRRVHETEVDGYECISFGTTKIDGQKTRLLTKINDDIEEFMKKAKEKIEELKEKERQKEVVFEVVKTMNSGMRPNWLVLDRKDKLLSDEQREKIRELRSVLGQHQLFAGATKHIDVDDLPVEEGEIYTLSEIIEICEKHSEEWQQAKKKEKEEEEKYQEALAKARETGENVKINQYTTRCNDTAKECNTDIVNVYVTPAGKEVKTRSHTY